MSAGIQSDKALISRWIETNPNKPWEDEVRISGTGIPVWALIGYLPAVNNDHAQAAKDYRLPVEAIEAAVAYYRGHKALIDARLAANDIFAT